jgi:hypothetical protein
MKTPYWIALLVAAFVATFIAGMGVEYLSTAAETLGPWKCVVN